MKVTLEESSDFPLFPDDTIVPVRILEVEPREPNEFRSWADIQWKFLVLDVPSPEFASLIGTNLWGQTSQKFNLHPDNKLRQWLEAALGVDLTEPGVEIETSAAVDREVRVLVGSYEGKKGKRNKVVAVMPGKGGSTNRVGDPWAAPVTVPDLEEPPF